jgi:superoxide dismutase, Fe-Mn family
MEQKANLLKETILNKEEIISEAKKIGIDKLPFGYRSISSFIDGKTMDVHYNKHYKGYVDKLNKALSKKNYGDVELENIIKTISRYDKTIRNNAGGAFNHALFWKMLSPKKQEIPTEIKKRITKDFGTINFFKKEFSEVAKDRFGSGWAWLVLTKSNKLKIMSTPNQDNPLMNIIDGGGFPILGLDVWEHAYYLKYQNKRDEYIENFWDVVNWDFVNKLFVEKTKTKLSESIKTKELIKEEVEVLKPNGRLNPVFVQTILKKVYPKCSPEIIRDYNPDTRIESPCYGKIRN